MTQSTEKILQRKIDIANERLARASLQNSLVAKIEHSIEKVFLDMLDLVVSASVVESAIDSHTTTIENMASDLFGILDMGDDTGLSGFDAQFVNATVASLSGAKKSNQSKEHERPPTQTDAALVRMLLNLVLAEIFEATASNSHPSRRVTMEANETEKPPLVYLLLHRRYALLRIAIAVRNDAHFGHLELVLPLTCIEKFSAEDSSNAIAVERESWVSIMSNTAKNAPLELDSVVQKMSIPLSSVLGMKKGDLLELSSGSLSDLTLEAQTNTGAHIALHGQLGTLNTHKAFRVTRTSEEIHKL